MGLLYILLIHAKKVRPWPLFTGPFLRFLFAASNLKGWGNVSPLNKNTGFLTGCYKVASSWGSESLSCNIVQCVGRHPSRPICITPVGTKDQRTYVTMQTIWLVLLKEYWSPSSLTQQSRVFCQHPEKSGRLTCLLASKVKMSDSSQFLPLSQYISMKMFFHFHLSPWLLLHSLFHPIFLSHFRNVNTMQGSVHGPVLLLCYTFALATLSLSISSTTICILRLLSRTHSSKFIYFFSSRQVTVMALFLIT